MGEHDPTTETLQDIIDLANEPMRFLIHLLSEAGDNNLEIARIAVLASTIHDVSSARINAALQIIEEHVGIIRINGMPEQIELVQRSSRATATLEKHQKSE